MACVAVYQVELEQGRMKCLAEPGLEEPDGLLYSHWFQEVLQPWVADRDQERIEEVSLGELQKVSETGKTICLHIKRRADDQWVELRAVVEQGSRSVILVIEDIHDLLVRERRKKRLDIYRYYRTRIEQLRKKGLACGMLILDMDHQCNIRFMEREAAQYLEVHRDSKVIKNLTEHIGKLLLKKMPTGQYGCFGEVDYLDINIGENGEDHWIQIYSRFVITERGRHYQYLIYMDLEPEITEMHLHTEPNGSLVERAEGYLFEWNIEDNMMTLSEDWDQVFLAETSEKRRRRANRIEEYVWKEDWPQLRKLFNSILSRENQDSTLVRLRLNGEEKRYAWCSINFISVFYDNNLPMYAVGMVKNINQKLKEALENSLENYGFSTEERVSNAHKYVADILEGEGAGQVHGILVLNMEHIIPTEDSVGLDILTYQYIQALTKMMYPHDRVWGEDGNLVLFLNQVGSRINARNKANRIAQTMERAIGSSAAVDIGIALYPDDGDDCARLIRVAREELWDGSRVNRGMNEIGAYGGNDAGAVLPLVSDIVGEWNRMVRVNKLLEKKMKMTEAELMLSQIKPHFIYNVLANIKSLIRQDPERAEAVIVVFTRFLRVQLDAIGKDEMAPFSECLKFVMNYMEIEQSRFPGKFKINFDIEYEDFLMPHFILQPLVENAIKHGARGKKGICTVTIRSRLETEQIVVEVEDDGTGFHPEQDSAGANKVGLKNIKARIACLMRGSLQIMDRPEGGTIAVIRIPTGKEKNHVNDYDSGR